MSGSALSVTIPDVGSGVWLGLPTGEMAAADGAANDSDQWRDSFSSWSMQRAAIWTICSFFSRIKPVSSGLFLRRAWSAG